MDSIKFCKFHGFGNDYIVMGESAFEEGMDVGALARAMCNRHTGIGSDGLVIIGDEPDDDADFRCRIINPDGSEAGFSGNGTRCAVACLYFNDMWDGETLRLRTKSGTKLYTFLGREGNMFRFLAELGKPMFAASEIPFDAGTDGAGPESLVDVPVRVGIGYVSITCVNVGNPVCALFVNDFDLNWRAIGKELESHPRFPERTNVVFVKVVDDETLEVRIWERGAGETSSSGTCCIAAAVAAAFTGKCSREVSVIAPGGTTKALWRDDDEMLIEGTAELSFIGEWAGGER